MLQLLSVFLLATFCIAQQQNSLPVVLSPAAINRTAINYGACPTNAKLNAARNDIRQKVRSLLQDEVIPILNTSSQCTCGGRGEWTRMAYLNMSDPSQQCPSAWRLVNSPGPVRGCGRLSNSGCDSAVFSSNGRTYTRVCGQVIGYQKGTPSAFNPSFYRSATLNDAYLEGVSLTHGPANSRHHIWSFAMALFSNQVNYARWIGHICFCTNINYNWPYRTPSFVGNDYFCATGNPGPGYSQSQIYYEDPLWDGEGCISTDNCCQFNRPPWFCKTLPQPTTDDLELRICGDQGHYDEDAILNLIDIYVM